MRKNKRTLANILLVAVAVATPVIYAYETGPDPGYTGAPGDNATGCAAAGCHTGTPAAGSVTITAEGGTKYVPGQRQSISVTIQDSTEKKYGFQLTARVDSDPKNTAAGLLLPGGDGLTQVLCADGSQSLASGCPSTSGSKLQWIEHTFAGYTKSGTPPSYTYTFNWTPPATDVGPVTLYAAGNAVTGAVRVDGTHTYLSKLTLTPLTAPAISAVVPHNSGSTTAIQAGSFVDIYGTNLAAAVTSWNNDFPTSLGGTSVKIGGKPAYLLYVSPTLINLQAADDIETGSVSVVVTTTAGGDSPVASTTLAAVAPALFLFDGKYPAAVIPTPDGSGASGGGTYDFLGPAARFPFPTRAVKKGETLLLFATGLGPVTPPVDAGKPIPITDPPVQHGTTSQATVTIGGVAQMVTAYETFTGEYQLNVPVPANIGSGDQPLVVAIGGAQTQNAISIPVQ